MVVAASAGRHRNWSVGSAAMAYQSLYRRYRPQTFAEVRGQEHVVSALRNAVVEDRVGHAYLLSGPRGTGKTSTARILAKVLNCENPVDGEPCGTCPSCRAIEAGTSFDVHELDAASNNGVEAIRDLIAKASLGTPGRTKVYILDELHMLSTAASNALLKTLEEPPEHVVFVLATTDPQKVLPTIRSRTQHFEVHLLSASDLAALVDHVVADAGLQVDEASKAYVLRAGAGSARDTLSALDRVVAAGGVPDELDSLDELVEAVCDRDTARALVAIESAMSRGRSPRVLGEALIGRLRDIFLAAVHADLSRLSEADRERCVEQGQRLTAAGATRALEVLGEAFVGIQDALDPRIPLEVALVRITRADADTAPAALAERLSLLEQAMGSGATTSSPPTPLPRSNPREAPTPVEPSPEPPAPEPPTPEPPSPAPPTDTDAEPAVAPSALAASSRPADGARGALAAVKPSAGATPRSAPAPAASSTAGTRQPPPPRRPAGSAPDRTAPPPASPPTASPPIASPPATPPSAVPAEPPAESEPVIAAPTPNAEAAGTVPDLATLTVAWSDGVLSGLNQRAKVRFAGGRWLSIDGDTAVFGLPNPMHAQRCEECRPDVEAALGAHFGRTIAVRVIVDEHAEAPGSPGPAATATEPVDESTEIDLTDLTDAHDVAETGVDRITAAFPGAKLVDPPSDRLL